MTAVGTGEFVEYMIDESVLPDAEARFYASNVILAIDHIHQQQVIYRDLKPEVTATLLTVTVTLTLTRSLLVVNTWLDDSV